jgi:GNAT superfamily N-acetyltransferase
MSTLTVIKLEDHKHTKYWNILYRNYLQWSIEFGEAVTRLNNPGPKEESELNNWTPEAIKNYLDNTRKIKTFFLAMADEEPVGYAVCFPVKTYTESVVWLSEFFIRKIHRKKGYGKLFLSEIERYAKKERFDYLLLGVLEKNIAAKMLYKKARFVTVSSTMAKKL